MSQSQRTPAWITFRVGNGPPVPRRTVRPASPARQALAVLSMCGRYAAGIVAILAALVMVADTLTR